MAGATEQQLVAGRPEGQQPLRKYGQHQGIEDGASLPDHGSKVCPTLELSCEAPFWPGFVSFNSLVRRPARHLTPDTP
jgi:hypothetical protein